jgi:hypothetical protein
MRDEYKAWLRIGAFRVHETEDDFIDPDVTRYADEKSFSDIKSKPTKDDARYRLRCNHCGTYLKIIYTDFKIDHAGVGAKEQHCLYFECGIKICELPHAISKETIKDFEMPIGKHKGKKLSEIPKDYLDWANKNMSGNLKRKIEAYLTNQNFNNSVNDPNQ